MGYLLSFLDELQKIAARIPFVHGTYAKHPELIAAIGSKILKSDPNPRGVYSAMKSRRKIEAVKPFAQRSSAARGGTPLIAHGKMDTKHGWKPFNLSREGKEHFEGDIEGARRLVKKLDAVKDKKERGEIWKTLHKTVGSWSNDNVHATLKPKRYHKA
jgi:hypothetical protein